MEEHEIKDLINKNELFANALALKITGRAYFVNLLRIKWIEQQKILQYLGLAQKFLVSYEKTLREAKRKAVVEEIKNKTQGKT